MLSKLQPHPFVINKKEKREKKLNRKQIYVEIAYELVKPFNRKMGNYTVTYKSTSLVEAHDYNVYLACYNEQVKNNIYKNGEKKKR